MASIAAAIDSDLQSILQGVIFSGMDSDDVGKIRELPKVGETLDVLPCLLIVPKANKSDPLGTEGSAGRVYVREIWIIDGHEGDFATDKPKRELWLEQAVNAIERSGTNFRTTLPSVSSVWDIQIGQIPTLDRAKLNQNYAYEGAEVSIFSSE